MSKIENKLLVLSRYIGYECYMQKVGHEFLKKRSIETFQKEARVQHMEW